MASGSDGKEAPLMSLTPVALIASRRSAFIDAKGWLWATRRRIVSLCCLNRSVRFPVSGALEGYLKQGQSAACL